eukprot:m.1732 g.1732  ORF g.1732 m.1732 type:complete len:77 (-) comp1191_c0_seq1:94-324(-)
MIGKCNIRVDFSVLSFVQWCRISHANITVSLCIEWCVCVLFLVEMVFSSVIKKPLRTPFSSSRCHWSTASVGAPTV